MSGCSLCEELKNKFEENQQKIVSLRESLKGIRDKINNSNKILNAYDETQAENISLKLENEKLRIEFTKHKSQDPIVAQMAQYQKAKEILQQVAYQYNTVKYTKEQLLASEENSKKEKKENERMKLIIKDKEEIIRNLRLIMVEKNTDLQQYTERGVDKMKLLEGEIKVLKERNKLGMYQIEEEGDILNSLDAYIDRKSVV